MALFQLLSHRVPQDVAERICRKVYKDSVLVELVSKTRNTPFLQAMDDHNCVLLLADLPQSGKSYLTQQYALRREKKVLYITPDNALGDKLELEGFKYSTANKLIGRDARMQQIKKTNVAEYDMFVVEEVYRLPTFFLRELLSFIQERAPTCKLFATGDPLQNPPIEDLNNVADPQAYYERVVELLFPVTIRLTVNKTISQDEQDELRAMKADCFSLSPRAFCEKYLRRMEKSEALISKAYYDPATGLSGREALYKKLKGQGVTRKDIKDFFESEAPTQVFAAKKKKPVLAPVTAYVPNFVWEADLIDYAGLKSKNRGYAYVLVVIDDFSKMVWAEPLKSKTYAAVHAGFQAVFSRAKGKPQRLLTDEEAAITSKSFQVYMNKKAVSWVNKNQHAPTAERVIGTLKGKLERYFTAQATQNWVGDTVRLLEKSTFRKGSKSRWSEHVYTLTEKSGNVYKLDGKRRYVMGNKLLQVKAGSKAVKENKARQAVEKERRVQREGLVPAKKVAKAVRDAARVTPESLVGRRVEIPGRKIGASLFQARQKYKGKVVSVDSDGDCMVDFKFPTSTVQMAVEFRVAKQYLV
ncbi:hypothetical protein WJX72_008796 [[Myrmecia] bisecta]|uniref:Integrase catalytic domain-containing protein n=1 Tax=[Myrmecia] bisecta TaxID=41462 RepID=A0AAW1Q597_9CHLO